MEDTNITYSVPDADYKRSLILMLLIAKTLETDNVFAVSRYNSPIEITLLHLEYKVKYLIDSGQLLFTVPDARKLMHLIDTAITKDNYNATVDKYTDFILNRIQAELETVNNVDRLLYQYRDYIFNRQQLIRIFASLGYKDAVIKSARFIRKNNFVSVRFNAMNEFRIKLKEKAREYRK